MCGFAVLKEVRQFQSRSYRFRGKTLIFMILYFVVWSSSNAFSGDFELAAHWAPAIYQDTDSDCYECDFITSFDFDGDWVGNNNWDNTLSYRKPAVVYYAVITTSSHWIITYMFFHPRDWAELALCLAGDCHENDSEGALFWVRRDGTQWGRLELIETQAHEEFFQYSDYPLTPGVDDLDGGVRYEGLQPIIYVQSKGHGVWAHPYCGVLSYFQCIWDDTNNDFPGGDGVMYRYGGVAQVPQSGNDRAVSYSLASLKVFWDRRDDICDGCTYGSWGRFDGDDWVQDSARTPWMWDDKDDGNIVEGEVFYDPQVAAATHLHGWRSLGPFSYDYDNIIYGGEVYGYVRDSATNKPIAGALLTMDTRGGMAVSNSDGSYHLFTVPGTFTMSVSHPAFDVLTVPNISVTALSDRINVDCSLNRAASVPAMGDWTVALLLCVLGWLFYKSRVVDSCQCEERP